MTHLAFNLLAYAFCFVPRGAVDDELRDLGITWQYAMPYRADSALPHSIVLWDCDNIPEDLPSYITYANELIPMDCIGCGLTVQMAEEINNHASKKNYFIRMENGRALAKTLIKGKVCPLNRRILI